MRGGTIVGEREVIFAGNNEVITPPIPRKPKELFAVGAVNAAVFMSGKGPGLTRHVRFGLEKDGTDHGHNRNQHGQQYHMVTLQGSPATTVAEVSDTHRELDINIDMISMPPNHGANATLSFTISDQDLIEVLSFANTLKTETGIKVIVSSVNHKISVYDPQMKNTPGMAARVNSAPSPQATPTSASSRRPPKSREISSRHRSGIDDTVLEAIEEAVNAKYF